MQNSADHHQFVAIYRRLENKVNKLIALYAQTNPTKPTMITIKCARHVLISNVTVRASNAHELSMCVSVSYTNYSGCCTLIFFSRTHPENEMDK